MRLVRVVRGAVGRALDQVAHRAEQVELGSAGEERLFHGRGAAVSGRLEEGGVRRRGVGRREEEVEAALRGGEARVLLVLLLKVRVVREQVDLTATATRSFRELWRARGARGVCSAHQPRQLCLGHHVRLLELLQQPCHAPHNLCHGSRTGPRARGASAQWRSRLHIDVR